MRRAGVRGAPPAPSTAAARLGGSSPREGNSSWAASLGCLAQESSASAPATLILPQTLLKKEIDGTEEHAPLTYKSQRE